MEIDGISPYVGGDRTTKGKLCPAYGHEQVVEVFSEKNGQWYDAIVRTEKGAALDNSPEDNETSQFTNQTVITCPELRKAAKETNETNHTEYSSSMGLPNWPTFGEAILPGDAVEYYSKKKDEWRAAKVVSVNVDNSFNLWCQGKMRKEPEGDVRKTQQGNNEVHSKPFLPVGSLPWRAEEARRRQKPKEGEQQSQVIYNASIQSQPKPQVLQDIQLDLIRDQLQPKEKCEVFIVYQNMWIPTEVDARKQQEGDARVMYRLRDTDRTEVCASQVRRRFDPKSLVEVYRGCSEGWVPAKILPGRQNPIQYMDASGKASNVYHSYVPVKRDKPGLDDADNDEKAEFVPSYLIRPKGFAYVTRWKDPNKEDEDSDPDHFYI